MKNTADTKNIMLNYGAILGFITIGISVFNYMTKLDFSSYGWVGGIVGIIAMIALIYKGIEKVRDTANGGYISLGEALKVGIAIALVGGLLSSLYQVVFLYYIDPEYLSRVQEFQLEKALEMNPNMPEKQIEMMQDMGNKLNSPWITFAGAMVGNLFFGFIFALFSGLILKKNDDSIDSL